MEKKQIHIVLTVAVVLLFFLSNIESGAAGVIQIGRQDSSTNKNLPTHSEVIVSCAAGGIPITKRISLESSHHLQQVFSELVAANAYDPCGERTQMLKIRFIELLIDLGLIAHGLSIEEICSLIEPPWSSSVLSTLVLVFTRKI